MKNQVCVILRGIDGDEEITMSRGATVRDVATQKYHLFDRKIRLYRDGVSQGNISWSTPVQNGDIVCVIA